MVLVFILQALEIYACKLNDPGTSAPTVSIIITCQSPSDRVRDIDGLGPWTSDANF